jgi:hypothetical protein
MLATLAGFLALLLGLSLLLLPLLVTELSRPRDSAWGAVVLLLGLVLVTSADRLTGSPMLAVLCGGLLVGRLGSEVSQARWRALSDEERQALRSSERWSRSLHQLTAVAASLLQSSVVLVAAASAWLAERRQGRSHGKRWVRAESPGQHAVAAVTEAVETNAVDSPPPADSAVSPVLPADAAGSQARTEAPVSADPGVRIVADFDGIDALLAAAAEPVGQEEAAGPPAIAQVDGVASPPAPLPRREPGGEAG